MRIGVLCSAGGAAFAEVAKACPHHEYLVLTDRPCGAERMAADLGLPWKRIEAEDGPARSRLLCRELEAWGAEWGLLYFLRKVEEPLLSRLRLLNIHPSLLPAFPGLHAVRQSRAAGCRVLGATLHRVTAEIDRGPIVAQVCEAMPGGADLAQWEHRSFLQKVALGLLAVDLAERGELWAPSSEPTEAPEAHPLRSSPPLRSKPYLDHLRDLEGKP